MTRQLEISANGIDFACLAEGPEDGPLALLLHGFPDTAHTWRHLMPELAGAGWRVVAPWMRGYAPTSLAADGNYTTGALGADAIALHQALGGDGRAVLVGHDWGAFAAYAAANAAPDSWSRVVTMAVPPASAMARVFLSYPQIRKSFYIWFFQHPLADAVVGPEFFERLWRDWSPGYDPASDMAGVNEALGLPENRAAALGYYRAVMGTAPADDTFADVQAAGGQPPVHPTLYLHGAEDGCIGAEFAAGIDGDLPVPGSRAVVVEGVGHFLHVEDPETVNGHVLGFLS